MVRERAVFLPFHLSKEVFFFFFDDCKVVGIVLKNSDAKHNVEKISPYTYRL